jgi:hypothetical protein
MMTDNEAITRAWLDMRCINKMPKRTSIDAIGRDQDAGLLQDSAGKWSWYGYASESHGYATQGDAARAYIIEHGLD